MRRITVTLAALVIAGPAYGADIGGDCCADLEERVAELEATTARKGNRVVSVEIYGQVNKALMVWDDGVDSDAYVVDNDYSGTRLGVRGSGEMKPGWTAGYRVEFEFQSAASNLVNAEDDDAEDASVRRASVYIESAQLGRVTIGKTGSATDDVTLISTANTLSDATPGYNAGFALRMKDGGAPLMLNWGDVASGLDTARGDFVRYDTPSVYGFIASAAWGEDDIWDVALRFAQEWNQFHFAVGAGYVNYEGDVEEIKGSASLKHLPSGLFVNVAAGLQDRAGSLSEIFDGADDDWDEFASLDDPRFYFVQGGIERKFWAKGATTIFAEYGRYDDFASVDFDFGEGESIKTRSNVDRYGVGIVQRFDGAATDLYVTGQYWDVDAGAEFDFGEEGVEDNDVAEDWWGIVTGARIQF